MNRHALHVLEYAEAMTATPPTVTDDMVEGLRTQLDRLMNGSAAAAPPPEGAPR